MNRCMTPVGHCICCRSSANHSQISWKVRYYWIETRATLHRGHGICCRSQRAGSISLFLPGFDKQRARSVWFDIVTFHSEPRHMSKKQIRVCIDSILGSRTCDVSGAPSLSKRHSRYASMHCGYAYWVTGFRTWKPQPRDCWIYMFQAWPNKIVIAITFLDAEPIWSHPTYAPSQSARDPG
jgi:hypothetical protein